MKPIVTDTYDFPTLIRRGYVYVDKTKLLHRLVSGIDGMMFFLSRPRRFGKSLMISTLEQIFKGERSLFKGLAIDKTDYDWRKYPIIRLDMTAFDHTSGLDVFKRSLAAELGGEEPIAAFRSLIAKKARASRGNGVVVLIDEYDSPVSGLLGKPDELDAMREFLQSFYRILKQEVGSLRFLMMTGVSKFTKLSVFSGLNNLTDLSMDPAYAGLLGYTPEELTEFFKPQIAEFAKADRCSQKKIVERLLAWYDSYRFSPKSETRVCNPVSVGQALRSKSCEAYWERTGSSTLIIERLRNVGKMPIDVEALEVMPNRLDVCDLKDLPFDALMYQGGYLTIKDVRENGNLILGIPNREVSEAVYGGFLNDVMSRSSDVFITKAYDVRQALRDGAKDFAKILSSVFAMVPHEWKLNSEAEAKRYFLLFMKMVGAEITPELESSKGRADAVVEMESSVFIFEFKYGKSAKAALNQIRRKGYAAPYAADVRDIVGIGVNYNPKTGEVESEGGPLNRDGGPVNCEGGPVNREGGPVKLLAAIRTNPGLKKTALSRITGITERSIKRYLVQLGSEVEFRGAPKNGGYFVTDTENKL